MKPKPSRAIRGIKAPAPRLTGTALLLIAMGLSAAFTAMVTGIRLAIAMF